MSIDKNIYMNSGSKLYNGKEYTFSIDAVPEIEITFTNPNINCRATILRNFGGCIIFKNFAIFKLPDQKLSHKDFCISLLQQLEKMWLLKNMQIPEKDIKITLLYSDVEWNY
jgi:hypothetical protein